MAAGWGKGLRKTRRPRGNTSCLPQVPHDATLGTSMRDLGHRIEDRGLTGPRFVLWVNSHSPRVTNAHKRK